MLTLGYFTVPPAGTKPDRVEISKFIPDARKIAAAQLALLSKVTYSRAPGLKGRFCIAQSQVSPLWHALAYWRHVIPTLILTHGSSGEFHYFGCQIFVFY